jgi:hypothetical protein
LITNKGKNILAKYLIGQAQSYASYVAVGIGRRPFIIGEELNDYSNQQQLEFEVLRAQITSRGFVYDEDGNPNIVFVAELPTEQRYLITELGIYPGLSNPAAGSLDSRTIYSFAESENWEYHTESATVAISKTISPLNGGGLENIITYEDDVFRFNSNNTIFASELRQNAYEPPRFLDTSMMLRGNLSNLIVDSGSLAVDSSDSYGGSHIHYNGTAVNFDSNSTEDELRLAFSLIYKDDELSTETPSSIRILLEFVDSDILSPNSFARFEVILNESDPGVDLVNNRYFVAKKKLSELSKTPNFTWNSVTSARMYVTVIGSASSDPSDNFYISLDGLRFVNTTIQSPLYGLAGYSVIKTSNGRPVVKESGTSSSVEFRFALGAE